jgi:hypothetical protein
MVSACREASQKIRTLPEGYLFTLIARRPLGLQDTRGGPGAAPRWAAGAGAAGHVAAPELPRSGQRELEPQDTWRFRICLGLGSGSWSRRARGGPGAAPGWAAGAGAAGHVAASELPRAVQQEPELQDTWRHRSPPQQGGEAQSYSLCGSAWIHGLLLALT